MRSVELRLNAREVTEGSGLLLCQLWDEFALGAWINERAMGVGSWFRSSLMAEVWTVLLRYGGGWMDDLGLLAWCQVRRLFCWERLLDPTTFGCWLRRVGGVRVLRLDRVLRRLVRRRWERRRVPERLAIALDSTVGVR